MITGQVVVDRGDDPAQLRRILRARAEPNRHACELMAHLLQRAETE